MSNILQQGLNHTAPASWTAVLQGTLSVLAIMLSVLANGLVVLLWLKFKTLRTAANCPILNLAIKGLLSAILNGVLFLKFSVLDREFKHSATILWTFQVLECFFYFLNVLSILNLMLNKYCAVVYQLRYYVWNTKCKSLLTIIFVWIVSAILDGVFQASLLSTRKNCDKTLRTLSFLELKFSLFKHAQTSRLVILFLPMGIMILFALTICIHLRIGVQKTRRLSYGCSNGLKAAVVSDSIAKLAMLREIKDKVRQRKEEVNSLLNSTEIGEIIKLATFENIVLNSTRDPQTKEIEDLEASATSNLCCSAQVSENNYRQKQSEVEPTDTNKPCLQFQEISIPDNKQCSLVGTVKRGTREGHCAKSTNWKRSKSENNVYENNTGTSGNCKNRTTGNCVHLERRNILLVTDQSLACGRISTEKRTNEMLVSKRASNRDRKKSCSYVKSGRSLDGEIVCDKCSGLANREEILSFVNVERTTKRKRKIGIQEERENAPILRKSIQMDLVNNRQRMEDEVVGSYYNAEVNIEEEALKIEPVSPSNVSAKEPHIDNTPAERHVEHEKKSNSFLISGNLPKRSSAVDFDARVFYSLKRKSRRRHVSQSETNLVKSTISILLCVVAYVVCHVPVLVEILLTESGFFNGEDSQSSWLQFFSLYFILLNDICNPVLYCLKCDRFYQASIWLFRSFCRRNERGKF